MTEDNHPTDGQGTLDEYWTDEPTFRGHLHEPFGGESFPIIPPILFPVDRDDVYGRSILTDDEVQERIENAPEFENRSLFMNGDSNDEIEEALEAADIDAEQIVEELEDVGPTTMTDDNENDNIRGCELTDKEQDAMDEAEKMIEEMDKATKTPRVDLSELNFNEMVVLTSLIEAGKPASPEEILRVDGHKLTAGPGEVRRICKKLFYDGYLRKINGPLSQAKYKAEIDMFPLIAQAHGQMDQMEDTSDELREARRQATKNRVELYINYLDEVTAEMVTENDLQAEEMATAMHNFADMIADGDDKSSEQIADEVVDKLYNE